MRIIRAWFAVALWKRVVGALILGVLFALVWPQATPAVAFIGELFVRAIRMLVAPIVLVTIASGITTLADPKRLGTLGARTIGLFAFTTAVAVSVGSAPRRLMPWDSQSRRMSSSSGSSRSTSSKRSPRETCWR